MPRTLTNLPAVLSFVLLGAPATAQPRKSPVTDWIAANAIPLATPEAGHGFADLQPLKKLIGNARIVALGEGTHGTREFFQLKHRMLEFLAGQMGFTIFSIEANMPEAYRLNAYVLHGTGDPAELLEGMYFWTWDTQEVLEMIRWMRAFNQSGKGRVEFTGFDMQTPTVALEIVNRFLGKYDPAYRETRTEAVDMAKSSIPPPASPFGAVSGTFPVADAAGKHAHFSGYIKTREVTGYAGLWWRVDGDGKVLAFQNLRNLAPGGTTDWQKYELEIPVDAEAKNINFGVLLSGGGAAWFDTLGVELDGKAYTSPQFDFDFEGARLKGFGGGGNGYRAQLDGTIYHSGRQSLQIRRVAPLDSPETAKVQPKDASAMWKQVVSHMEDSRAAYRKAEAGDPEIEWAIQNARVVLQCQQMRAGEVSRDASMAANVKWILDQSPEAKIVLWAHNGHVASGGYSYPTMGSSLRKLYGDRMVVFGFAFNQGMFQAISQEKHVLKDFTVPAAPEGSLDAMLASAKIPLFALDVRPTAAAGQAPLEVSAWFQQPHRTRSIGAVYPEESDFAFLFDQVTPKVFDAVLFVEKTTAAHRNGPAQR